MKTVSELIEKLQEYPPEAEVILYDVLADDYFEITEDFMLDQNNLLMINILLPEEQNQ